MRSQHQFSQVPNVAIPRSSFNLSYPVKTTFDADYLIPIARPMDIIPGDTINWRANFFMRLATPLYPIMDNMYFESFAFFVPYRLLWDNWERMHGAQDDPADSIDFTVPAVSSATTQNMQGTSDVLQLFNYMGLPYVTSCDLSEISALPFRAYALIWNEWFRDENLQDSLPVSTGNGPGVLTTGSLGLMKRGKRHDYFTSCLPWPQKGSAVSLPLGTAAPLFTDAIDNVEIVVGESAVAGTPPGTGGAETWLDSAGGTPIRNDATEPGSTSYPDNVNIFADLTNATAATINDIRLAVQTQALLERDARMGTRYVEVLKAHWGVTSPDFRLQRPEFLGGGSSRINITPVAQTSGQPTPVANDKLGELAGFGTVGGEHGFTQSFDEHGVVIFLGNVRSDITYSQGLDRYWSKATRYDFFYPILAQIGEQSVLNSEIFYQNTSADDDVFGYQERYAEYRFQNGMLTGLMRPGITGTLEAWHLSEEFSSLPALGDTFIQSETGVPLDRAIAIPTEPHFIADFFHDIKAARPMPLYGVPGSLARL